MTVIIEPKSAGERMFAEITTEEQARSYLEEKVQDVEWARMEADGAQMVEAQQAKFRETLIRYGTALGALVTLMHCRKLSDEAYTEFHGRIQGALASRVVSG